MIFAAVLTIGSCFNASAAVNPTGAIVQMVPNNTDGTYVNCPIYDFTVYNAEETKGQFVKLADGIKLEGKTYNLTLYFRYGKILMNTTDWNRGIDNGFFTVTDNGSWGTYLIACPVVDSQKFSTNYSAPTYLSLYGFSFTDSLSASMSFRNGYVAVSGTTFSTYVNQGKATWLTAPQEPTEEPTEEPTTEEPTTEEPTTEEPTTEPTSEPLSPSDSGNYAEHLGYIIMLLSAIFGSLVVISGGVWRKK